MVRYSAEDKRELLRIHNEERAEGRCRIVKGLMAEAAELVALDNSMIKDINDAIEALNKKKAAIQKDREAKLKEAKLLFFDVSRGNCTIHDIHPSLQKYDVESREGEKQIRMLPVR